MTEPKVVTKDKYAENLAEIKSLFDNPTPSTSKVFAEKEAKRKDKIEKLVEECIRLRPFLSIPSLSQTCISYLLKIYIEQKTGRRDEIDSRYLKKGTQGEDNSMSILSDYDDTLHFKNEVRLYNQFIQGECDIDEDERITDIKSSWDIFTFIPHTLETELSSLYWWQGQCYMWLFGKKRFRLVYVLTDTPVGLIDDEKKRLLWKMGTNKAGTEEYRMGCEEIEHNCKYSDLKLRERVFEMPEITFDEEAIEKLKVRVNECREWLDWYHKKESDRLAGVVVTDEVVCREDILVEAGVMTLEQSEEQKARLKEDLEIWTAASNDAKEDDRKLTEEFEKKIAPIVNQFFGDNNGMLTPEQSAEILDAALEEVKMSDIDVNITGAFVSKNEIEMNVTVTPKETASFEIESPNVVLPDVGNKITEPSTAKQIDLVDSIAEIKGVTEDEAFDMIGRCKTVEECNVLYPKIKHLPSVVDVLRKKKNNLANPIATPSPEPPKKEKVKEEKKNQDLYNTLSTLTASKDVLDFYNSNSAIIDEDPELMKACEKRGIELERQESKYEL